MGAFTPAAGGDDGVADPRLIAALDARAAGLTGWRDVVAALVGARMLVPLLEVAHEELSGSEGTACAGGKTAMAAVTVRTAQGSLALAFTGMPELTAWREAARPLVSEAARIAYAAVAEGAPGLLVDAGSPHEVVVPRSVLRRVAAGTPWPPAWQDPLVRDTVLEQLEPALAEGMRVRLAPPSPAGMAGGAGLRVELAFRERLDAATAARRAQRVARLLAVSSALGELVDGDVEVGLVPEHG